MVVDDDVECDLFRAGYIHIPTQPNVAEDESNTYERENDWHLLFPEAVQDINHSPRININDTQTSSHVQLRNDQVDDSGIVDHNNIQQRYDDNDETNTNSVDTADNIQKRSDSEQDDDETNTNSVDTDDNIQQGYECDSEYDNDETKTNSVDEAFTVANISRVEGYNKQYSILSDSSSEDLIIIDHKVIGKQPNTSNNFNLFKHEDVVEDDSIGDTATETSISSQDPLESPMLKPSVQVMHKHEEKYDPKRIPSAVFDRCDSLIPAEWSATSNESLFSLNIGNASIGRDQAILLSGELKKHGGLLRKSSRGDFTIGDLQEIRKLAGLTKTSDGQLIISTSTVPTIDEVTDEGEVVDKDNHANKKLDHEEEVMKVISAMKLEEEKQLKQQNIHSSSISLHSNASEDSNYSFAFPIFGEANVLMKGYHHQQNSQQAPSIQAPVVALQPVAPSSSNGFFSYLGNFCCTSCCCCQCTSCSSCISCSSCFSCSSCPSCSSCSSCFSCIPSCFSCPSCKNCWGT